MLYTASYFEPNHQHGFLISISRTVPNSIRVDGSLPFLAPSAELLADWKAKKISEAGYVERYREQIKESWSEVKVWLDSLNRQQHTTLLCWERRGKFCHRNLVAKLVQKYRPDCFGGCDVVRVEMEKCQRCSESLRPGLDASFCPGCKTWYEDLRS